MPASHAQRGKTTERRRRALALHLAGASYDTIADQLGYAGRAAACKDIGRTLAQRVDEQTHEVEVLRQQEAARLDELQAGLWPAATSGDPRAVTAVMRIIDRRCRLLGLDAPPPGDLTLGRVESEIARLTAELAEPGRTR